MRKMQLINSNKRRVIFGTMWIHRDIFIIGHRLNKKSKIAEKVEIFLHSGIQLVLRRFKVHILLR